MEFFDAALTGVFFPCGLVRDQSGGIEFQFTSPDLDASCETSLTSTTVVDLGIWAAGLVAPASRSDYDCSGGLNTVTDLGVWAMGLGAVP